MKHSRWVRIARVSNSEKMLFVCLMCGRVSQTPDKECTTSIFLRNNIMTKVKCDELEMEWNGNLDEIPFVKADTDEKDKA